MASDWERERDRKTKDGGEYEIENIVKKKIIFFLSAIGRPIVVFIGVD